MSDQVWSPTRGFFTLGGGAAPESGGAAASNAAQNLAEGSAPIESGADSSADDGATQDGGGGPGLKVWAPVRGHFEIAAGGAGKKKAAPKKAAPAAAPTTAAAAPAVAAATKKPAAPKATSPGAEAKAAPAPKKDAVADPQLVSVTTVPKLADVPLFSDIGAAVYDEPDSETTLYRVPTLNIVFAVSSLALLVITLMVLWQDYDREWKHIQADWNASLVRTYETELHELSRSEAPRILALEAPLSAILDKLTAAGIDVDRPEAVTVPPASSSGAADKGDHRRARAAIGRIERLVAAARSSVESTETHRTLRQEVSDLKNVFDETDQELRFLRGDMQAAQSLLRIEKEEVIARLGEFAAGEELSRLDAEFTEEFTRPIERKARELEVAQVAWDAKEAELEAHVAEVTRVTVDSGETSLAAVEAALDLMARPIEAQEKLIASLDDNWRNVLRNSPLVDALQPTYKIDKVVVDGLFEDLNFLDAPRVDRCRTCHLNIDVSDPKVYGHHDPQWGSVYASHPRPDLYLQDTSPHPYLKFGCTGCHYGDGRATDFNIVAHMPRDEEQEEEWEAKFHWHEKHHQVQKMRREKYISGGCRKCHFEEDYVDGADALNLGLEAVRTYGCFGCHRMENFDVLVGAPQAPADILKRQKAGPNLRFLADKVTEPFLYRWIRNPWHFRPSTNMPRFFDLSNNRGEMTVQAQGSELDELEIETLDFKARNGVEALALATYLWDTSAKREPQHLGLEGDAERGRAHFSQLGCLGCHSVKQESQDPEGPTLAELDETRGEVVAALRAAAATVRKERSGDSLGETLASFYEEAADGFQPLSAWFSKLLLHRDLEGLYSAVRRPLERARAAEEMLERDSVVDDAVDLAAGYYDRWAHNTFAPDLSAIGSKFDVESESGRRAAEAWLQDWVIEPHGHDPETVMPSFRLDRDPEGLQAVADIATYLLTLRDEEFEASPVITAETLQANEREILRELAFENLRASHVTADALKLADGMNVREQLAFVGHRLVRRYGCFGCHNGIADVDLDPGKAGRDRVALFDNAQAIGAELSTWGDKSAERIDFGPWGHQPDGTVAIAHDRNDWLDAKLEDTRRFDVFPARKDVDPKHGKFAWATTNRLVQKKPDELLKMPLFPFHDDPEVRDAVVTFITSLVADYVPLEMTHHLTGSKRDIETGARLVRKYNCAGCHRVGVDPESIPLAELPAFANEDEDDTRSSEWQKETWLAKAFEASRPRPGGLEPAKVTYPAGMLLPTECIDPKLFRPLENEDGRVEDRLPEDASPDALSLVQVAHRHFDPLPGFLQGVLYALDGEETDPDLYEFVTAAAEKGPHAGFLADLKRRALDEQEPIVARMLEAPYGALVTRWLEAEKGFVHSAQALATAYFGTPLVAQPEPWRRLSVRGFREGAIRYYYGTEGTQRANAPPPLVRQGERTRGDWLFHFLLDVQPIRPWLRVRMPSFRLTQDESRAIVAYFRAVSGVPQTSELFQADRLVVSEARAGEEVFVKGLECVKCHPTATRLPSLPILSQGTGGIAPEDVPVTAPGDSYWIAWRDETGGVRVRGGFADEAAAQAAGEDLGQDVEWSVGAPWSKEAWGPDLGLAATRLRPAWMAQWISYPPDFAPGTKMPQFFGTRAYTGAVDAHLDEKERGQIRDLLQYLRHMDVVTEMPAAGADGLGPPVGGGG